MTLIRKTTSRLIFLVALLAGVSCASWEGEYGNVYVDNHSSSDIVIQYPPGSADSGPIPAHSTRVALTHVLLGTRMTFTDIRDAHTNKLLFNATTHPKSPVENRWFEGTALHISYRPLGFGRP